MNARLHRIQFGWRPRKRYLVNSICKANMHAFDVSKYIKWVVVLPLRIRPSKLSCLVDLCAEGTLFGITDIPVMF